MKTPMTKPMLAAFAATLLCLGAGAANEDKTWMVVDLRTGALSYYGYDLATATNTFNTAEYKTEKMVFRRVPAGLYWVRNGAARAFMENDYYMAMFTVTVGQYAIITNSAAVVDQNDEENLKPQGGVSWREWEGTSGLDNEFPNKRNDSYTGACPLYKLDERIHAYDASTAAWLDTDLPTVAMWEVAARAMPANDGSRKTWPLFFENREDYGLYAWPIQGQAPNSELFKPVGSCLPNDWGLYDILGNCHQWCLDGIADWPAGDEIYHYSQRPCQDGPSKGATPYVQGPSYWLKTDDGELVLIEWDADDYWERRCYCGGTVDQISYVNCRMQESYSFYSDLGARLAIVCRNEVSAPPVTVTWQDDDGNVIEADAVPFGTMPSYGGATPTKPSTVYGTYEFTGWTPQIGLAVSNTTYTAKFDSHTIYYAIKWLNWDGTELYADSHWYGYSPGYYGPAPTKPPTVEYDYTFAGWSPEPAAVTGETTYVAQFVQSARKYDITWLNYDGSTNATTRTPYNTIPEFVGETPAKPSTVQYAYTFAGWTPELEPATSNTAYTAMFDESIREYPVNFYNNTGSELLFTTNVPYGSTPVYLGATPTKPSNAQYDYIFAKWHEEIVPVTGATTYYARFDPILRSYDITWLNYDGTVLCVTNVPYGETPAYNGATPTKPYPADPHYGYSFTGWTPEVSSVTGTTTYTANFVLKLCDWMVVDLRTGSISEYAYDLATATNTFNTAEYKTEKMVFRRVPEGLYWCRGGAHVSSVEQATMGRPYYIGMFPVTEAQYALMLDPTAIVTPNATNLRPQANVSYSDLRGSAEVPGAFGEGLADGPIYRLNAHVKNALGTFDLPTVAMWEVASRAMPSGDASHKDWLYTFALSSAANLGAYAWYKGNDGVDDGYGNTTKRRVVGTRLPNDWGIYDMPGNVWNWCLDNYSDDISRSQTPRRTSGNIQLMGGSYGQDYDRNYVYSQAGDPPTASGENVGFRLAMISDEEIPTYTVTWCDYDGTVLATDKIAQALAGGVTPTYGNALPERPGHYCIGWSPSVVPLEGDTTYTALYKQSKSGRRLVDISVLTDDYTARDGDVLTGKTTQIGIIIPDGATVTLSNAKIEPTNRYKIPILCQGDATVEIEDDSVNTLIAYSEYYTGSPGMAVGPSGKTLTINGDTGKLAVSGGRYAPGIGTRSQGGNGNVVVNGGDLTITSGDDSPGIGARDEGDKRGTSCGGITINGGRLTVSGSQIGIGALNYSSCGTVAINGGELVVASGNLGIGGNCAGVAISGGIVSVESDKASPALGATGGVAISGGDVTATARSSWAQGAAGIGTGYSFQTCGRVSISGGTVVATGANGSSGEMSGGTGIGTCYGNCGNVTITGGHITATKGEYCPYDPIRVGEGYTVTVASDMKQTYSNDNKTLTLELEIKETTVTVGGVSDVEVVRGEDGKTLSFAVAAGTDAGDIKLDIGGVDVTKGFRVTVNGTEATAVLLAPYEVQKEEGAADGIWTENGDGTVTLNVTVVPGLYYAADSAESLDALACPGASTPATGATTLTAPKPVGDKGFFKVWVSDTPFPEE